MLDVHIGPAGLLTGKARISRDAADRTAAGRRTQKLQRRRRKLREHVAQVEARVVQLRRQLTDETTEAERIEAELAREDAALADDRVEMEQHGWADSAPPRRHDGRRGVSAPRPDEPPGPAGRAVDRADRTEPRPRRRPAG